jgi:hypothetical protein
VEKTYEKPARRHGTITECTQERKSATAQGDRYCLGAEMLPPGRLTRQLVKGKTLPLSMLLLGQGKKCMTPKCIVAVDLA